MMKRDNGKLVLLYEAPEVREGEAEGLEGVVSVVRGMLLVDRVAKQDEAHHR